MLVEMQQGTMATPITPSNSSPVSLTANTPVKPSASGYAIQSYTSKTPSDTTPPSVASGDIVKANGAGYLFEHDQTETTLWTNNSPTSSFGGQSVSLSDDMTKYKYLKFTFRQSTSVSTESTLKIPVDEFKADGDRQTAGFKYFVGVRTSSSWYARYICYESDTAVYFGNPGAIGSSGSSSGSAIPTKISGVMV